VGERWVRKLKEILSSLPKARAQRSGAQKSVQCPARSMISTRNLSQLPDIAGLIKLTKSLAMLDAIMMPEWQYRYYSFNSVWDTGEQMASMRDGSGDEWFCLFSSAGAALKGFDHESEMSPWANDDHTVWKGVLDQVPVVFTRFLNEPAFSMQDTTFCIWRTNQDSDWRVGKIEFPDAADDPDGSEGLLSILDGNPETYRQWAEEYYEKPVSLSAVQRLYQHESLTPQLVKELNPEIEFDAILADAAQIGYPVG
jgi:hypothetical protein